LCSKANYIYAYPSSISSPVILYGCETWSFTLREERRLNLFVNEALRRILGPEREVVGTLKSLRNEGLHNLTLLQVLLGWSSQGGWDGRGIITRVDVMRNACKTFVGKHEGNKPLGRPKHRREYNIRMDRRGIGWQGADWIHLAQNQLRVLVSTVMELRIP